MNYSLNILDEAQSILFSEKEEVKQMPCFPDKDSIKMIDNVLVVKVAD